MSDNGGGVAEGWYPDPSQPGTERWWNGTEWGQETRATGSPGSLAPPATPPPVGPQGFQVAPQTSERAGKRSAGCFGIATGVMFGIVGAFVLMVGGCAVLLSSSADDSDRVSIQTSTTSSPSGSEAESLVDEQVSEATEADASDSGPADEADDVVGCTRVNDDTIELEVVNNSPKTSSYLLTVGFFDADGSRLADEAAFVNYLRPGERLIEEQFTFEEQGTLCEVIDVDRFAAESLADEVAEVSACEVLGADVLGDFQASVSATNGSPETSDYSIEVAFVDPDGIRRGHGTSYVEAVRTGETAPGEVFSTTDYVEGYSCEVVGVTRNANN